MMGTVSARYLKYYYNTCLQLGCAPEPLLAFLGAGKTPFDNPTRRYSNDKAIGLLHLGAELSGDTSVGLEAGKNFRPSTFLDIGLAFSSSKNLRQALAINEKYQALTQQFGKTHLSVEGDQAYIYFRTYSEDSEYMRPAVEAAFAGYAVFGRWLTWLYDQEMAGMRFRHARPLHHEKCEELFACNIEYNARVDAMILDATIIDMPLPNSNPQLLSVLLKRLDKAVASIQRRPTTIEAVSHYLLTTLHYGTPSITKTAAAMEMSERTLRRRLAEEGASFRSILEDVRKEACEVYVHEKKQSISQIAHSLGYSEHSAFTRAFRKWYKQSPTEYLKSV